VQGICLASSGGYHVLKKDRKIGTVTIGQLGVSVGGRRGRRRIVSSWDELNE